jgi:DNA-binding response OmpR family regulator
MDIAILSERNSLITCETEIKLGAAEFEVIEVLYRRINCWVTIQDIEEELHKGVTAIRMTLERIVGKLERNAIDPSFLLEKRRGGYHRLRGVKTLQWL